jgi:hypothetical protein
LNFIVRHPRQDGRPGSTRENGGEGALKIDSVRKEAGITDSYVAPVRIFPQTPIGIEKTYGNVLARYMVPQDLRGVADKNITGGGAEELTVRSLRHMVLIAAILVLPAVLAQAGDRPTLIPIFSGNDGSRACVEVSHFGIRAKAVPVLAIPRDSARRLETSRETGGELAKPSAEGEGKAGEERVDIGNLLKRQTSRMVRKGPEGVSFGGAFDLVGDIRDAWEKGTSSKEKRDAVVRVLNHVPMEGEPVSADGDHGDRPAGNLIGKPAFP